MNIEELRLYCINKPAVTEGFPFDESTLVFKVMDKMFALISVDNYRSVNLKCDPERAIELRESYIGINPGFHMSKKHWNTVTIESDVDRNMLMELIDHSYDLVVSGLPKYKQKELKEL